MKHKNKYNQRNRRRTERKQFAADIAHKADECNRDLIFVCPMEEMSHLRAPTKSKIKYISVGINHRVRSLEIIMKMQIPQMLRAAYRIHKIYTP